MINLYLHKNFHSHKLIIRFVIKVTTNLLTNKKVPSHPTIRISIRPIGKVQAKLKLCHTVRVTLHSTNCKTYPTLLTASHVISAINRFIRMINTVKFKRKARLRRLWGIRSIANKPWKLRPLFLSAIYKNTTKKQE
jgi:hypothetical protein